MQPNDPGTQPAWGSPPGFVHAPTTSRARFEAAVAGRAQTDYLFGYWTALGWTILTFGVFGLYAFYQLMRRMRDHNRRRLELLDAALALAWEEADRRGLAQELTPAFQRASGHLEPLRQLTREFRDPVLWLLISIAAGLAQIVGFIFLDQDLVNHDRGEGGAEHELATIFARLGQPLPLPDPTRVKGNDRYVARVIATVATFGIYQLWWWHDQMIKPNEHFQANWAQEDSLAGAVSALAAAA